MARGVVRTVTVVPVDRVFVAAVAVEMVDVARVARGQGATAGCRDAHASGCMVAPSVHSAQIPLDSHGSAWYEFRMACRHTEKVVVRERLRGRFWIETGLSLVSLVFMVLTVVWKDWIEIVFRVDPDHASGSLEWAIVAGAAVLTITFAAFARAEWRRRVAATTTA